MPPQNVRNFEECPLNTNSSCQKRPHNLKGPVRVVRLCILGIFLPGFLLAIPLYMRYHVYGDQLYPLAMSDMRLIDNRVSTTWCQRQLVNVNTTFNAFLMPQPPSLAPDVRPLSMVRHLVLEDDTKEYWGFYLLQGSSVTVSTCVRWPGSSLIVIRGHKHLHECAYIGDNSSEELDELMEAIREGTYVAPNSTGATTSTSTAKKTVNPPNKPQLMKRHRQEVQFRDPRHQNATQNHTLESGAVASGEITDPKMMKKILDSLSQKQVKKERQNSRRPQGNWTTVAEGESKYLKIDEPGHGGQRTVSEELLGEVLEKLTKMGKRGSMVLERLNQKMKNAEHHHHQQQQKKKADEPVIEMAGRHYSKPSVDFDDNIDEASRRRKRRSLQISHAYGALLNENDEKNDAAIEEDFVPDGIADHRGTINETTRNDMSRSEFWSSFSSSEEALLNCAGLILNLPLTPHHECSRNLTDQQAEEAYLTNTVTYKVPSNGYYFFVFNSENEIQPNYIRVQFHLEKTVYDVSNPVATCSNSTERCALDLKFFSSEKLVLELPVKENDSLWNEEFVVVSECEPRSAIYAFCVIAVPVLVILFAFT